MANTIDWGQGAVNNTNNWGKGKTNATNNWGAIYDSTAAGETNITGSGGVDPDAQAFITVASITDPTQQSAINTLVTDLKGYGVWTKMKAIYPFVGGTASSHKFNLKDPQDTDSAFRLVFNGGWTHSATGAKPNGTNAYADTKFNLTKFSSYTNASTGVYLRTNILQNSVDFGQGYATFGIRAVCLYPRFTNNLIGGCCIGSTFTSGGTNSNSDSRGFFAVTRNGTTQNVRKRGTSTIDLTTTNVTDSTYSNLNIYLSASNELGTTIQLYSSREQAFAFIGDYLTSAEIDDFYTAVQAFNTTLGRSIGTQTVSDADAQAFVTNAGIVDQVEANAINNLVIGLKADSLWTKMKAVYPFVGGTSASHKFNLKDPQDTDAAFRLLFAGGWTHSATGARPNGTNGYAKTYLIPSTHLTTSSAHFAKYNRTNDLVGLKIDGVSNINSFLQHNYAAANAIIGEIGALITYTQTDSRGLFTVTRTATNSSKLFKNTTQQGSTNTSIITNIPSIQSVYIGARNSNGIAEYYNTYQCAFASIGDGLTDTDASNLYNRVQAFNTTLNRNV